MFQTKLPLIPQPQPPPRFNVVSKKKNFFHFGLLSCVVGLFATAGKAASYHAKAQRFWVRESGPA